ncbi:MAG: 16S rRNA (guanine(527)-N(7))-methyltransferase RsmG [Candidatus Thiodiazotropha sp. (ex Ctena orbiculata)]|nr:16S rRNA (guanine(527)-N(7))-methyltransferase RsmG [Candidatus Thiodiazotropha taylori]PUB90063.1 MAG: 16S rRNA (guanine(527)-N(7))-methyltransferase RsmG [gamma proteobacterium symbiont of Ctena orbiculata]MBT2997204.1 16S rRNA (guanine(527)-N(7))-methyltransferase RsmG [Candidatus Thiodiazotropha taylori]MBT3001357.1 16S rRNA (guanine(527)-N(7))-methyltransferase RsmG [Candidatus Thiodiazotropha taylori]MBV2107201.1 16S rRNA (guanine(527)-N(7))-methyltransferase RsmG [Candidatus Thiodiazo
MARVIANETACRDRLLEGAGEMGLVIDSRQQSLLIGFLSLLVKWNRAYNLTAVRDPLQMVGRHLLDSLVLLPHLRPGECLDIGTGAGLPGIPLAIMRPDIRFVLLDGNSKKIRFVRQVKLELGLENIDPVHARIEAFHPDRPFSLLVARAFSSLPRLVALSEGLQDQSAEILAMKGSVPEQEIAQLGARFSCDVVPLKVPFEAGERCLVRIRRAPDGGLQTAESQQK